MIREYEIRRKLASFLRRELSLDVFEKWLIANSWNAKSDSAKAAFQLAASIELVLFEYSNDHLTEDQLRAKLSAILANASIVIGDSMFLLAVPFESGFV